MTKELQEQAEAFRAQRESIDQFIKGDTGEDLKKQLEQVSTAVKAIRRDVASQLSYGRNSTFDPAKLSGSISNVVNRWNDGGSRHASNAEKVSVVLSSHGTHIAPEEHLDSIPRLLGRLVEDTKAFNDADRSALSSIAANISMTQKLLENAIKNHDNDRDGPISDKTAILADKALKVIEKHIMPKLGAVQKTMVDFEKSYRPRHGNDAYMAFLSDMEASKPKPPEPETKAPEVAAPEADAPVVTRPKTRVIMSKAGGYLLAGAVGAGLGVAGDEGIRSLVSRPDTNGANVRTLDPEDEAKPRFLKKLTSGDDDRPKEGVKEATR